MDDAILLTIHLRHQKDKNLGEINARPDETGLWRASRQRESRSFPGT